MHPDHLSVLAAMRTQERHDDAAGSILLAVARGSRPSSPRRVGRETILRETFERRVAGFARAVHAGLDRIRGRAHKVVR
jgi:hypothetical protein